jgi:hypothetical protein
MEMIAAAFQRPPPTLTEPQRRQMLADLQRPAPRPGVSGDLFDPQPQGR